MSDAVMVPRERLIAIIGGEVCIMAYHGDSIDPSSVEDAADAVMAALAASTPVGGWEEAERDEVLRLLRTINRECDIGRHEADVLSIIDRLAAPPPPSVSIDNGSRPQEAVPTGDAEPAVVDRRPFADVFAEAYGWTVDVDGYLAGLVAGDMGYDQTDLLLSDLLVDAQVAEDRRNRTIKSGPYSWPFHEALMAFVSTGHAARTQPADGCSSNEGAA